MVVADARCCRVLPARASCRWEVLLSILLVILSGWEMDAADGLERRSRNKELVWYPDSGGAVFFLSAGRGGEGEEELGATSVVDGVSWFWWRSRPSEEVGDSGMAWWLSQIWRYLSFSPICKSGGSSSFLALATERLFPCLADVLEPEASLHSPEWAITRWMKPSVAMTAAGGWVSTHPSSPVAMKRKGSVMELRSWAKMVTDLKLLTGFPTAAGDERGKGLDCVPNFLYESLFVKYRNFGQADCRAAGADAVRKKMRSLKM